MLPALYMRWTDEGCMRALTDAIIANISMWKLYKIGSNDKTGH